MKELYLSDKKEQIWFKSLFVLSLLPVGFVRMNFELISAVADLSVEIRNK